MKTVTVVYSYRSTEEREIEVPDSVDVENLDEDDVRELLAERSDWQGFTIEFSEDEEFQFEAAYES